MTSHTLYMTSHTWQYKRYICHLTHYILHYILCPHTQSIDNITPTLCMTSHSPYVWQLLPYTSHHFLTLWHQTTMFMSSQPLHLTLFPLCVDVSSHPLYWWYHTNCISEITSAMVHNIISIVYDMTHTVWHHNHCFHGIRFPTYHITSRIYDMSSPIAVTSQTPCLWIHVTIFNIKHMVLRQYTNIYEITTSVCVSVGSHTL